jgi:hypothetical protein
VEERCRARLGLRSDAGVQGSVLEKCGRGAWRFPGGRLAAAFDRHPRCSTLTWRKGCVGVAQKLQRQTAGGVNWASQTM